MCSNPFSAIRLTRQCWVNHYLSTSHTQWVALKIEGSMHATLGSLEKGQDTALSMPQCQLLVAQIDT